MMQQWFRLNCYGKEIKVRIEESKLEDIINQKHDKWFVFKRAVLEAGGKVLYES